MEWQILITAVFIGAAMLIVARRFLRILSSQPVSPCGSCGGCSGKGNSPSVTPLVQLGSSLDPEERKKSTAHGTLKAGC